MNVAWSAVTIRCLYRVGRSGRRACKPALVQRPAGALGRVIRFKRFQVTLKKTPEKANSR
jgi:hypothetical protein